MKNLLKNIFAKQTGMSFFEMLAGIAIFGGVSVVALKNLDITQKSMNENRHRVAIEATSKSVSDLLKKKALCEAVLSDLDIVALNNGVDIAAPDQDGTAEASTSGDASTRTTRECIEPDRLPDRRIPQEEYQRMYSDWMSKCRNYNTAGSTDGRMREDPIGTPGDGDMNCQEPPSEYRYTEEEYARMREQHSIKVREYEECLDDEGATRDNGDPNTEQDDHSIDTTAGPVDLSRTEIQFNRELQGGLRLSNVNIKLDGASGEVPIHFTMSFEIAVPGKFETIEGVQVPMMRTIDREIEMMVQIVDGRISCDNIQAGSISGTATEKICGELGGVMVGSNCNVSGGIDSELGDRLRLAICESLDSNGNGFLAGGICSRIQLAGNLNAQNVSPNKIVINGDERNLFDNTSCSVAADGGAYLGGYQVAGQRICKNIVINFTGGEGNNCDLQDGYYLTGQNTGAGTATCTNRDYSYVEGSGCVPSTVGSTSAGTCSVFANGTCTGNTAGDIQNVADGEACGSGMACSAGSCIAAPDCSDTYTLSGDNTSASGEAYCDLEDRRVNFDFSGCDMSTTRAATAAVCQRIQAGTCTGTTAPVVENFPDGTDCGGGNTCTDGVCGSGDGDGPNGCWEITATQSFDSNNNPNWFFEDKFGEPCEGQTMLTSLSQTSEPCYVGSFCTYEAKRRRDQYTCTTNCGGGERPIEQSCYASQAECAAAGNTNCYEHPQPFWRVGREAQRLDCGTVTEIGYCRYDDGAPNTTPGNHPRRTCDASINGIGSVCNQCATGDYDLIIRGHRCVALETAGQWCNYEADTGAPPPPIEGGGEPGGEEPPMVDNCDLPNYTTCNIYYNNNFYIGNTLRYDADATDPRNCTDQGWRCQLDTCSPGQECRCRAQVGPLAPDDPLYPTNPQPRGNAQACP